MNDFTVLLAVAMGLALFVQPWQPAQRVFLVLNLEPIIAQESSKMPIHKEWLAFLYFNVLALG